VPQLSIYPLCAILNERECRTTPQCRWIPFCESDFTAQEPDAGTRACGREYFETGICQSTCLLTGLCA